MIKIKMNKEEILEAAPCSFEEYGHNFNKMAYDAALHTLVEKYGVEWERYESASRENMAHIVKYYDEIYDENDEKIADIIIVVNEAEETVSVTHMDELQPYFRAFLIHTGVDPEQATNTEYMLWINRMWQKWREAHGIDRWAVIGAEERRQFERWLFETMPEK